VRQQVSQTLAQLIDLLIELLCLSSQRVDVESQWTAEQTSPTCPQTSRAIFDFADAQDYDWFLRLRLIRLAHLRLALP
jgi:hypothetical protein